MAIIKKTIDITKPLSNEQKDRVHIAASKPVTIDVDCPELSDDQIREIKKVIDSRKSDEDGQEVTIYLTNKSMERVKAFGDDYKGILNRLVNIAICEPELVKKAGVI